MKKVWLVNKYAMPPQYESRLRTIMFAHYLKKMGYEVKIIGCSIMHNMNTDLINDGSLFIECSYDDLDFIHVKSLHYKKTGGIKRLLSEIIFHYRVVRIAKRLPRPDYIIATTNALISNPIMEYAHKVNAKYITESLDLWPDNFVDYGLINKNSPLMKFLFRRAHKNYYLSDACVFSWIGYKRYFSEKKWTVSSGGDIEDDKLYYINNGVDLTNYYDWETSHVLEDGDLNGGKRKIIYLGSIRLVNNLVQLIKAAEILKDRDDIVFLIYGDGDDRQPLYDYCIEKNISNVVFKAKWTDPKYVPFILSKSYINILNYISSDFARYGISSSKMFQYMAAGKPIVCNIDILENPIINNHIGVSHAMKDEQDYANAILSILDLPKEEYAVMCERARNAAKEFDYPYLTKKMADVMESLY